MLKRMTALLAAALLTVSLAACGTVEDIQKDTESGAPESSGESTTEAPTETETPTETEAPKPDYDEQLRILADNYTQWVRTEEYSSYSYMVTDLDQNGRLELVCTICRGTGFFSSNEIWEINETYDGVTLCDASQIPEDGQPDLISFSETTAYLENGVYTYIFNDFVRMDAGESGEKRLALSLSEGKLGLRTLGSMSQQYDRDAEETITTYRDENDAEIDEAAYLSLADTAFPEAQKYRAAFGWCNFSAEESDAMTAEQWLSALQTSWACFVLERQ